MFTKSVVSMPQKIGIRRAHLKKLKMDEVVEAEYVMMFNAAKGIYKIRVTSHRLSDDVFITSLFHFNTS